MNSKIFKRLGKGVTVALVAGLLFLSQTTVSEAALITKKVEMDPQITITNNGDKLSENEVSPIIIDGTTYLPVRALGTALNKIVRWDGPNRSVHITDAPGNNVDLLKNEIYNFERYLKTLEDKVKELEDKKKEQDEKIAELEKSVKEKDAEIARLKAELRSQSSVTLSELQKQLNRDHGTFRGMEFDITLRGNGDNLTVDIEIDLSDGRNRYDYYRTWIDLSDYQIERFISDITDDIWEEYRYADISGYVTDTDENKIIVRFSGDAGNLYRVTTH